MAPQENIPPVATVLATIGTASGVYKIWHNWRHKQTDGLPGTMMFLWALSAVPFGIYSIVQNFSIPLQIQPQIFCALVLVSWAQTLIYHNRWRTWTATLTAVVTGLIFGAVEAGLTLALRGPYARGVDKPVIAIGIVAAILLGLGLIPPYFEIWKRRGRVVGINFLFLLIDFLGALFSLLSVVLQETFDVLGGILFIVVIVLEIGIFSCHAIWLFRTRQLRKEAKLAGETFDEYMDRGHSTDPEKEIKREASPTPSPSPSPPTPTTTKPKRPPTERTATNDEPKPRSYNPEMAR